MASRVNISAAGNIEIPAYLALRKIGYDVTLDRRGPGDETWHAEKDGNRFVADGLIELLGVVSMFETRGENWRATDNEFTEFMQKYGI